MKEKVTIQDIADALGLSRNTVSKAINNTGVLADATRERIIQKSIEMGYKQFAYVNSVTEAKSAGSPITDAGDIALLTSALLGGSHFSSTMLDKFQQEISKKGYVLTLHRVTAENIRNQTLPLSFRPERTKAIMCIEMFDDAYSRMLSNMDIPTLFVDGSSDFFTDPPQGDLLLMDNTAGIVSIIKEMAARGITRIGFIGVADHCLSFLERYMAFRNAMYICKLPIEEQFCLTDFAPRDFIPNKEYKESMHRALASLKELPELFICANDFVAIDALRELRSLGYDCPRDVLLSGFDDSPESRIVTPALTTCHIHSQITGYMASSLLLERIEKPNLNYRMVYTATDLKFRKSTGH